MLSLVMLLLKLNVLPRHGVLLTEAKSKDLSGYSFTTQDDHQFVFVWVVSSLLITCVFLFKGKRDLSKTSIRSKICFALTASEVTKLDLCFGSAEAQRV